MTPTLHVDCITVSCPACAHPITCTTVAAVLAARDAHERWHLTNPFLPALSGAHLTPREDTTDAD